jgi:hypothetical protein
LGARLVERMVARSRAVYSGFTLVRRASSTRVMSYRRAFPVGLPVTEVTEHADLTLARFENQRAPQMPLVFRGLVTDWPARSWNFPQIVAGWPKRSVRAVQTASDGFTVSELLVSPEDLVQQLEGRCHTPRAIPPDWRFDALDEVPELATECPPPRVYRGRLSYQVFMGRDTVTRAHYHALHHALICQVHGKKRVVLCPPADFPFLYAHPISRPHFEVSRVDPVAPNIEIFPKLSSAHPLEATLEPGDALFVPLRWWHAAFGIGATMSASLFWKAHWREQLRHARPRDLAGIFFWSNWRRVRRRRSGVGAGRQRDSG